ncbi:MAG: AEC family transporter [Oscillospiraceae bacterium]|nr:AEC family transporter [Oscillospiraceae bacterium]
MTFFITFSTVAVMLLYAVPGYVLVRSGATNKESIPAFAKLLMYICQPCLTVYCFGKVEYSEGILKNMAVFFIITFLLQSAVLFLMYLLTKRVRSITRYRVCCAAAAFGNCTFMGVPILEAVMPDYPEAVVYSNIFFLGMSILGWTAASYIITQDKKYISIKKIIINPATIGIAISLLMMISGIQLPDKLNDAITLMGRMSTPLCMIVIGMRLAALPIKPVFTSKLQYLTAALKLIVFPLIVLGLSAILPIDDNMAKTLFILSCTPTAAVVLTFTELLGEGQDTAANTVLLSTLLCVVTTPVMMLLA